MTKEEHDKLIKHWKDEQNRLIDKKNEINNFISLYPNKEKIDKIRKIVTELEEIQQWHLENDRQKNEHVKHKISVCYSMMEFIRCGVCVTHKALLPNATYFGTGDIPAVNMGVEDIHNHEVSTFVRKLAEVAFDSYYEYIIWSTHPSRRVYKEKIYTNAVRLAIVDVNTGVDLKSFDLEEYYGEKLIIDLGSISTESKDKIMIHIITYSRDGNIVFGHENLEFSKENNIVIDVPLFKTRLN